MESEIIEHNNLRFVPYDDIYEEAVLNLDVKEEDLEELYKMNSNMSKESYLRWHLDNHRDITYVCLYDGVVSGIIGIDKGWLFLATIELSRRMHFSLIKCFTPMLESLMELQGIKEVKTVTDADYTKNLKWIKKMGFKKVGEIEYNGNLFYDLRYVLP